MRNLAAWGLLALLPVLSWGAVSVVRPGFFDPDVWWVAAAGREIVRTGSVPTHNAFSFVDGNEPWLMHEWLLGPLFAWGLAHVGARFFSLVTILFVTLTLTIIFRLIARESRSSLAAWIVATLAAVCFSARFTTPRPTNLSLVFPVAILSLTLRPSFRVSAVVSTILVMAVWTNAHGSFPLGLVIIAAGALSREDRPSRLLALGGSLLVTLCNPYGLRLYVFVFHYLAGDQPVFALIHRQINEFLPLWRARTFLGPQACFGLVGLGILIVAGLRAEATRARTLWTLPLLILAARSARHLELAGLLSVMLLVPAANQLVASLGAPSAPAPAWLGRLGLGAGAFGVLVWLGLGAPVAAPRDDLLLGPARGAALLAKDLPDGAHVYVPFQTAGVISWFDYPRGVLTMADSRNDCFRADTLEAFLRLESGEGPADLGRQLAELGVTHALVPEGHAQAPRLAALPDWKPVASELHWTLFARMSPPS